MTNLNPASFTDYKTYILALEDQSKGFTKGFRRRLAEALECQAAFVTHVLGGRAHLSLEQGLRAARHFGLGKRQQKYFVTLIEHARAGTKELREHFEEQLVPLREELLDLKHNIEAGTHISEEAMAIYYSHWMYAAVHMLITIPKFQQMSAVAKALGLREHDARVAIEFLVGVGLASLKKDQLVPGQKQLHLSRESALISSHHTQWRLKAMDRLHLRREEDLHYSTVSSLSHKDFLALKTKMVEWVRTYTETIRESPEEELCSFTLDFYRLTE